jgi:hypothetical protein
VTEADDVLFGRAEMERAFTALGERLARRGVVADVFVVGGAAMALAYDATRVTRDIDANVCAARGGDRGSPPRGGGPGTALTGG